MKQYKRRDIDLFGYRLSYGIRAAQTEDFKWFYSPLPHCGKMDGFVFFYWFGHKHYLTLRKIEEEQP